MKYFIIPSVFYVILIWSCKSEIDNYTPNKNDEISYRTSVTLEDDFVSSNLVYPEGTIISSVSEQTIEIDLPNGYYFIIQYPDGTIAFSNKQCHECRCTQGGPSGCDPVYSSGGFGCDHYSPCTTCEGKTVPCSTSSYSSLKIIAIIDSTETFRFIQSESDFESLSDFQIGDSTNTTLLFDTLNFQTIRSTLFNSSYFTLNQSENTPIVLSAYKNKIIIFVKPDWRDYVIGSYDTAFYIGHNPSEFTCSCLSGSNPFDLIRGSCTLTMGDPGLRCHSTCNFGCRMGLEP